jgi:hypothetical protein
MAVLCGRLPFLTFEEVSAIYDGVLPPVLDTAGVAALLGLNPRTVLVMARDGRLPGRRLPGGRKYQFLTHEVLSALALDGHGDSRSSPSGSTELGPPPHADVDPCDLWGPAPARRGVGWATECLSHWMALAEAAGLAVVCITTPSPESRGPFVGVVAVDGLTYRVVAGPRKRVRVVDDDGDLRWDLVDSVWVEPATRPDE